MSAAITSKAISNVSKLLRKLIVLGLTLAFLLACWKLAVAVEKLPDTLSDDFVNIELAITAIAVDVRYFGEDNFLGASVDGYQAEKVYLSRAAADALGLVQADLQNFGLGLKVFDGYRPQVAVDHFVRWAQDPDDTRMKQAYYPAVAKQNLFRDGYIAERSGHSRGSTVDLTLMSLDSGQELDMGTAWDFFDPKSWPSSEAVSVQQRANRMLLRSVMRKQGFAPIQEEWWHFTLENEPYPDTYFEFPIE